MAEELKPCPFCSSEQVTTSPFEDGSDAHWAAICKACGARIDADTEAEAITAWNARVSPPTPTEGAEIVERQLELVYIPGVWRCAKCSFRLVQSNLNPQDGSITARDDPGDKCPNDGAPLWRVTYRDEVAEAHERWEEQVKRAVGAEAELTRLRQRVAEVLLEVAKSLDGGPMVPPLPLGSIIERAAIAMAPTLFIKHDDEVGPATLAKRDELRQCAAQAARVFAAELRRKALNHQPNGDGV